MSLLIVMLAIGSVGVGALLYPTYRAMMRDGRKWRGEEPAPDDGLVKCSACGVTYHKSWGSICGECSGAYP